MNIHHKAAGYQRCYTFKLLVLQAATGSSEWPVAQGHSLISLSLAEHIPTLGGWQLCPFCPSLWLIYQPFIFSQFTRQKKLCLSFKRCPWRYEPGRSTESRGASVGWAAPCGLCIVTLCLVRGPGVCLASPSHTSQVHSFPPSSRNQGKGSQNVHEVLGSIYMAVETCNKQTITCQG